MLDGALIVTDPAQTLHAELSGLRPARIGLDPGVERSGLFDSREPWRGHSRVSHLLERALAHDRLRMSAGFDGALEFHVPR